MPSMYATNDLDAMMRIATESIQDDQRPGDTKFIKLYYFGDIIDVECGNHAAAGKIRDACREYECSELGQFTDFVGEIGVRVKEREVTVFGQYANETTRAGYGWVRSFEYVNVLRDNRMNLIAWKSSKFIGKIGETMKIDFTPKHHSTGKKGKVTYVSRVSLLKGK